MCMCVRAAMAEGRRLQRLLFASFPAREKMVFSEHLTKAPGTFSPPSSSSPSAFPRASRHRAGGERLLAAML